MPDGKASLELFLSHRASLVRYAKRISGEGGDAEDIVQEAWLRAAGAARLPAAEMMAYLHMTVRNLALNRIRRKRIEARIFDADGGTGASDIPSDMPDPEAAAISRDYARIVAALQGMPDDMRTAVEMHRIGGEKLKDIAAHLGGDREELSRTQDVRGASRRPSHEVNRDRCLPSKMANRSFAGLRHQSRKRDAAMMKPEGQQQCRASSDPDRGMSNQAIAHGAQYGACHQAKPERQIRQPSKAIAAHKRGETTNLAFGEWPTVFGEPTIQ